MKAPTRILAEMFVIIAICLVAAFALRREDRALVDDTVVKDKSRRVIRNETQDTSERTPGFYLSPQSGNAEVHIFDGAGTVLHTWHFDAARARLLPNCNVLVVHGSKWGLMRQPWRDLRNFLREYTWDGEVAWEVELPGPAHHEARRLENGNTLVLYRTTIPDELKEKITDPRLRELEIRSDALIEVNQKGEKVWEWFFHEHADINSCGKRRCAPPKEDVVEGEKEYDWTHTNSIDVLGNNHWYESGDLRFKPGNIMILPRNWSTVMIIDKESGEIVWDYQGKFKGGLSGGHESHMIPEGYPGAGNVLVFDNGRNKGKSVVLEINPVTKEVVWSYEDGKEFYSRAAGSMQRFKNGNTLISEDVRGRVFEVTPDGQIIWSHTSEYRTCRTSLYPVDYCPKLSELATGDSLSLPES